MPENKLEKSINALNQTLRDEQKAQRQSNLEKDKGQEGSMLGMLKQPSVAAPAGLASRGMASAGLRGAKGVIGGVRGAKGMMGSIAGGGAVGGLAAAVGLRGLLGSLGKKKGTKEDKTIVKLFKLFSGYTVGKKGLRIVWKGAKPVFGAIQKQLKKDAQLTIDLMKNRGKKDDEAQEETNKILSGLDVVIDKMGKEHKLGSEKANMILTKGGTVDINLATQTKFLQSIAINSEKTLEALLGNTLAEEEARREAEAKAKLAKGKGKGGGAGGDGLDPPDAKGNKKGKGGFWSKLLGGLGAAAGMASIGLGIGGFISGIMVWSGVDAFKGEGFKAQMTNLVAGWNEIGKLNKTALVSLGAMVGAGALFGAVLGPSGAIKGAIGMTAVGLGLGGFMSGIMAAGEWSGFTGQIFADQMENLVKGFNHLGGMNKTSFAALTSLAALGAIGGAVSIGTTAFATGGMALAGLGLGGFMAGMAAAGDITGFDGSHFAAQAKNIADGLSAFSGAQLGGLAGLMAVGGILGAIPGGVVVAGAAATGMGLIGVGIGAFVGGIAGIGDVLSKMGVDGSGLKTMLNNISGGLEGFDNIDGSNFKELGTGVAALGVGLAALFGVNGLTKVTNFFTSAWGSVKSFFTGEEKDTRTGMEKLIDSVITPFENIDFAKWNGINASGFGDNLEHISRGLMAWAAATPGFWSSMGNWAAGIFGADDPFEDFIAIGEKHTEIGNAATAIDKLADALIKLNALDFDADKFQFQKFASDLAWATKGIHVAMYGGTYNPPGIGKDNRAVSIRKGKGLIDIPALDFENASTGINLLQSSLSKWSGNPAKDIDLSPAQQSRDLAGISGAGGSNIISADNNSSSTTITYVESPSEYTDLDHRILSRTLDLNF